MMGLKDDARHELRETPCKLGVTPRPLDFVDFRRDKCSG